MNLITWTECRTAYTQDGQPLLEMDARTTANVIGNRWNAEHLRALATACLEAAREIETRHGEPGSDRCDETLKARA